MKSVKEDLKYITHASVIDIVFFNIPDDIAGLAGSKVNSELTSDTRLAVWRKFLYAKR